MSGADGACRLCGGATRTRFHLDVLDRHRVGYHECADCGSLQTDPPWWLPEAYASGSLSSLDTGAAQRNLEHFVSCLLIARIFGARNLLDLGGGDGLLCRLLRDRGLNCFVQDRYAAPLYAPGFTEPDFERPDGLLAFEVFEHFADPAAEMVAMFERGADFVAATTGIYDGQGPDWWYLAPEAGEHVFFHSRKGLQTAAARHGYETLFVKQYALFARSFGRLNRLKLDLAFRRRARAVIKAAVFNGRPTGAWQDHLRMRERLRTGTEP